MKRIALTLSALLLAFPGLNLAQDVPARLVNYDGVVDVIRQGLPLTLYPELPLVDGDIVHTREGRATVRFVDRSEVSLQVGTRIKLSEGEGQREIMVEQGTLRATMMARPDLTTRLRTGDTSATLQGQTVEYRAAAGGAVEIGVVAAPATQEQIDLESMLSDGSVAAARLGVGQRASIAAGAAPGAATAFGMGDIFASPAPEAAVSEEMAKPAEPATAEPAKAAATSAPAAADQAPDDAESDQAGTLGELAVKLVNGLGIASSLPANFTARDAMEFLSRLGLTPCSGSWEEEQLVSLDDLICIVGMDPKTADILILPVDEMINRIIAAKPELFWIQARQKQSISPFAP